MTKTELVEKVAEQANLSKKDADEAVRAVLQTITDTLAAGDKLSLPGFGTFEVRERAERNGKNPKTKEVIKIAACKAPAFKAGKQLKDACNK